VLVIQQHDTSLASALNILLLHLQDALVLLHRVLLLCATLLFHSRERSILEL
jgi:hypothetical protein